MTTILETIEPASLPGGVFLCADRTDKLGCDEVDDPLQVSTIFLNESSEGLWSVLHAALADYDLHSNATPNEMAAFVAKGQIRTGVCRLLLAEPDLLPEGVCHIGQTVLERNEHGIRMLVDDDWRTVEAIGPLEQPFATRESIIDLARSLCGATAILIPDETVA